MNPCIENPYYLETLNSFFKVLIYEFSSPCELIKLSSIASLKKLQNLIRLNYKGLNLFQINYIQIDLLN